ncbi:MAG: DUF937 domain-containing protein [Bacteroidota bacterium]
MDVLGQLMQQMSGGNLDNLSNQLGVDKSQVSSAIGAALPMIMGAMAKNAQSPEGAQSLDNALAKDHDGSLLDNLSGFLGSSDNGPGGAILGHVFGNNRGTAEAGLSKMTDLNPSQAGSLLENLAPVVMGYLGKQKQSQGLDASGIVNILMGARNQASNDSGMGGMAMSMLNSFLDKDGDGSAIDDIGGMLGNMFGGKK